MYLALSTLLQEDIYHGYEMMKDKPPGRTWLDWVEAKFEGKTGNLPGRDAFDFGLGSYAGVTDVPCYCFWRELMDAYPEA